MFDKSRSELTHSPLDPLDDAFEEALERALGRMPLPELKNDGYDGRIIFEPPRFPLNFIQEKEQQ